MRAKNQLTQNISCPSPVVRQDSSRGNYSVVTRSTGWFQVVKKPGFIYKCEALFDKNVQLGWTVALTSLFFSFSAVQPLHSAGVVMNKEGYKMSRNRKKAVFSECHDPFWGSCLANSLNIPESGRPAASKKSRGLMDRDSSESSCTCTSDRHITTQAHMSIRPL